MTNDDLIKYFNSLGWRVEKIKGQDQMEYLVIRDYQIKTGNLAGRNCDVAIQQTCSNPYIPPPAIHTKPALVPMDMGVYRTQKSGVGSEWQYWSRILRTKPPTPQAFVTHIATIFNEVKI